jgi:hypothetical protein
MAGDVGDTESARVPSTNAAAEATSTSSAAAIRATTAGRRSQTGTGQSDVELPRVRSSYGSIALERRF